MKALILKYATSGWNRYSFSLVSILSFGITFLQNFIFAAVLDKEAFGKIFLINTLFSTFCYLSIFGLDTTLFKYYFDDKFDNKEDLRLTIFFVWLLLSSALFVILLLVGYTLITSFHFDLLQYSSEFIPLLASGILFSFFLIFQQFFIASKNLPFYFLTSFAVRVILLTSNLGAIWFFGPSIETFVKSYFFATLIMVAVAIVGHGFLRHARRIKRVLVQEIFSFSAPLIANGLISISFTNGYRIIISTLISFADLAVFGIISQVSSAYYIGLSSLILPHNATAFQYLQDNKTKHAVPFFRTKVMHYALAGFLGIMVISFVLLKYFKGGLYFEGYLMLPILLVGQFVFLMYAHEHIVLSYWKRTSRITMSTLTGIIVILSSVYFLIEWLGVWGACIASALGYASQYFASRVFTARLSVGHA